MDPGAVVCGAIECLGVELDYVDGTFGMAYSSSARRDPDEARKRTKIGVSIMPTHDGAQRHG
jgi:hypothetical protein